MAKMDLHILIANFAILLATKKTYSDNITEPWTAFTTWTENAISSSNSSILNESHSSSSMSLTTDQTHTEVTRSFTYDKLSTRSTTMESVNLSSDNSSVHNNYSITSGTSANPYYNTNESNSLDGFFTTLTEGFSTNNDSTAAPSSTRQPGQLWMITFKGHDSCFSLTVDNATEEIIEFTIQSLLTLQLNISADKIEIEEITFNNNSTELRSLINISETAFSSSGKTNLTDLIAKALSNTSFNFTTGVQYNDTTVFCIEEFLDVVPVLQANPGAFSSSSAVESSTHQPISATTFATGIELTTVDIIIIIVCCVIGGSIIILGIGYAISYCLSRKRGRNSFSMVGSPTYYNIATAGDYTLTKLSRQRPDYCENYNSINGAPQETTHGNYDNGRVNGNGKGIEGSSTYDNPTYVGSELEETHCKVPAQRENHTLF